jgi:hypothetical protein
MSRANSLGGGLALELGRTGRARTATAFSPVGFARGRERAFARTSLSASRSTARVHDRAVDIVMSTGPGRTLTLMQFFGTPWRLPAAEAIRATRNLAFPRLRRDAPARRAVFLGARRSRRSGDDRLGPRDRLLIPRQCRRAREIVGRARHVWLAGCAESQRRGNYHNPSRNAHGAAQASLGRSRRSALGPLRAQPSGSVARQPLARFLVELEPTTSRLDVVGRGVAVTASPADL